MSENINTPERIKRTAEAASQLYGSDFSAQDHPAMLNRPTDMKLSKEEREAFANPPFSKAQIKSMSKEYVKQMNEQTATLSPGKMETFEESAAMKRGEDTDMNIDGRTSPAPTLEKNPFSTPENSPKRKKDSIENFTKAVFSPKRKKKGGARTKKRRIRGKKSRKIKKSKKGKKSKKRRNKKSKKSKK